MFLFNKAGIMEDKVCLDRKRESFIFSSQLKHLCAWKESLINLSPHPAQPIRSYKTAYSHQPRGSMRQALNNSSLSSTTRVFLTANTPAWACIMWYAFFYVLLMQILHSPSPASRLNSPVCLDDILSHNTSYRRVENYSMLRPLLI